MLLLHQAHARSSITSLCSNAALHAEKACRSGCNLLQRCLKGVCRGGGGHLCLTYVCLKNLNRSGRGIGHILSTEYIILPGFILKCKAEREEANLTFRKRALRSLVLFLLDRRSTFYLSNHLLNIKFISQFSAIFYDTYITKFILQCQF